MGSTLETIIVGVVVGAALVWAAVAGWRSVKNQGACSSCGSSGECPIADNPEALKELSKQGRLNPLDSCQPHTTSCRELAGSPEQETTDRTT